MTREFSSPVQSVEALACLRAARRCERGELVRLIEAGTVVLAANALIHALQRERGATSAWLATGAVDARLSGDARFRDWLDEHRKAVDRAQEALDQTLADRLEGRGCDARLYARLALALDRLAALARIRTRVDQRDLEAARAAGAYTRVIHALLDVVFEVADGAADPPIARALVALFQFALGKEQAGQERAIGAAALARGHLDARAREALIARIDAQERCFSAFVELAAGPAVDAWRRACVQPCIASFERLRRQLLLGDRDLTTAPHVKAERWFVVATERIDAMKAIEDALEQALEATCAERLRVVEAELQTIDERALSVPVGSSPISGVTGSGSSASRESDPRACPDDEDEWPRIEDLGDDQQGVDVSLRVGGRTLLEVLQAQSSELREIRRELDDARRALEEGRIVQRAKALLMRHRGLTEDAAHRLLRRTAMAHNRRMVEVAAATLELAEMFAASTEPSADAPTRHRSRNTEKGPHRS